MSSISYNFTIIVSYKNTEEYLSKCILSVLKQSIGFEKRSQIFLQLRFLIKYYLLNLREMVLQLRKIPA